MWSNHLGVRTQGNQSFTSQGDHLNRQILETKLALMCWQRFTASQYYYISRPTDCDITTPDKMKQNRTDTHLNDE